MTEMETADFGIWQENFEKVVVIGQFLEVRRRKSVIGSEQEDAAMSVRSLVIGGLEEPVVETSPVIGDGGQEAHYNEWRSVIGWMASQTPHAIGSVSGGQGEEHLSGNQ